MPRKIQLNSIKCILLKHISAYSPEEWVILPSNSVNLTLCGLELRTTINRDMFFKGARIYKGVCTKCNEKLK